MTWAGQPDGVTIGPDADGVGAILSLAAAVVAVVGGTVWLLRRVG